MKIYWTRKSQNRFREIYTYIQEKFGTQTADKFKSKIFNFLDILEKYPQLGTLEVPEKNINISKQTQIFYRLNKNHISLLTFFDNRQNPTNRPK